MGLIDFILFPFYVLVFYVIFSWRRKRITDPILKKYHQQGFWIKVLGTIAFTVFHTIISPGNDSRGLYFDEGINISRLISGDFSNIKWLFSSGAEFDQTLLFNPYNQGYFSSESNYFVTRLVTLFSFISFRNYMVINLIFSMISYSGVWRLYKFFYEQYPHLHKKLAIAIIYLPTFIFWSSGILKDSLCTGMMGWMTYSIYVTLYKKESILKNSIIAILSGYTLVILKAYILFSFLPFLMLFLIITNFQLIKKKPVRIMAYLILVTITTIGFFVAADKLQEELGSLALDKLSESVKMQQTAFINMAEAAGSSFSLGVDFDGSNLSLLKMAPAAITATFFRPFIWESKNISTLLSSLESLALMIFTLLVLIKAGPLNFIQSILKKPMIMFCFLFSIVFAIFVGATTLNFGTLVRYKIPCIPFYIIALVLINEYSKEKKKNLAEKKQAEVIKAALTTNQA